ncbi:formylglycine-generating enzyme family protein [Myxococcota bacterium]|nr:formylglycine-generating enzyme family protein [Myxococcota bacterium]
MECQDQGECREGSEATEECGFCGTRTRLCGPECSWFEWSECTGQGECEAGLTGTWTTEGCVDEGFVRRASCDDTCQWVEEQPCTGDCLITPRAGGVDGDGNPDFKDEVCIPAGPFLMGDSVIAFYSSPQHRVIMTPFLIDVYEVTVARYRECVDAGACSVPTDATKTLYFEAEKEIFPISGITRAQAIEFCNWDDGRTIPSEAQWEKAARGPEPRVNLYVWGDTLPTCEQVNMYDSTNCSNPTLQPVNDYAESTSYYGLYQVHGNVHEYAIDNFYYYEDYSAEIDLVFIDTGSVRFINRGGAFNDTYDEQKLTARFPFDEPVIRINNGIRCARRAY